MADTLRGGQIIALVMVAASLCLGQILFKYAARDLEKEHGMIALAASMLSWPMLLAFGVYGATTILWVYLLSEIPLSRAYPFVALAFALVPLLSWLVFAESIDRNYLVGMAMILAGLYLII